MPDHSSWNPIHFTPVPVNVNFTWLPASIARMADPPLLNEPALGNQLPDFSTAAESCSTRPVAAEGMEEGVVTGASGAVVCGVSVVGGFAVDTAVPSPVTI